MDITKQNFISADSKTARNSYNKYFTIGDTVKHDDESVDIATIVSFEIDIKMNEVRVNTDQGYAHIDFINKVM